jgi:hypothetical protein
MIGTRRRTISTATNDDYTNIYSILSKCQIGQRRSRVTSILLDLATSDRSRTLLRMEADKHCPIACQQHAYLGQLLPTRAFPEAGQEPSSEEEV